MSGSKRRTGYRKTTQDEVLFGLPEPSEHQCLALVHKASGSNLFEVTTEGGESGVGMLPTRFRKLVWLKRGDLVILSAPSSGVMHTASGGAGAVTHMIDSILYEDALKHLRAIGRLPASLEQERETLVNGSGGGEGGEEVSGSGGGGISGGWGASCMRKKQGARDLPPEDEEKEGEEGGEEQVGGVNAGGEGRGCAGEEVSMRKRQGPRDLPPEQEDEYEEEGGAEEDAAAASATATAAAAAVGELVV